MTTTMAFSMNNSSAGWNGTLRGAPLLSARGVAGYWGHPTATVDWCEINYTHSPYIAEFWNTISNVLFVVFGIYGFSRSSHQNVEWRFRLLFVSMAVIGLGSAMFHGTLQLIHQQFDETPMIWGMLVWIYTLYDDEIRSLQIPDRVVIASMFVFGIGFAVLHAMYNFTIGFQLLFATMAFSCLGRLAAHYRTVTDTRARALARLAMFSALLGFAFWMVDYNLCSELASLPFNPQGHAWWHVLMSISTYSSPVFMQFIHAARQQKHAEIVSAPFGLKTIVIHDAQAAAKKNV